MATPAVDSKKEFPKDSWRGWGRAAPVNSHDWPQANFQNRRPAWRETLEEKQNWKETGTMEMKKRDGSDEKDEKNTQEISENKHSFLLNMWKMKEEGVLWSWKAFWTQFLSKVQETCIGR